MMEVIGWIVMILVITSVWYYSEGNTHIGNWITVFATAGGMVFFLDAGHWSFFAFHLILFVRAAWMILRIKVTCRA